MPRYGDLDKLSEQITTNHCGACGIYNGELCCSCPMNDALRYIDEFPTADVAPRAEVARDIFAEIKEQLRGIFDFFRQDNDIRESCAIMFAISEVGKIEKKYTEE